MSCTRPHDAMSASDSPEARPAPAMGSTTQNTAAPTMATGTVEASMKEDDQRGAMTGAIISVEMIAAIAAAADDAPSAISENSSVSRVPACHSSMFGTDGNETVCARGSYGVNQ